MLYIFDINGTITKPGTDDLLPGVAEWFAVNGPAQHARCAFAFAANYGSVGLRHILEAEGRDVSRFATEADVMEGMRRLSERLTGRRSAILPVAAFSYYGFSCGEWAYPGKHPTHGFWDPHFPKPEPGMLQYAMDALGYAPADTVMIGDSNEDFYAARAAGVRFVSARRFFEAEDAKSHALA